MTEQKKKIYIEVIRVATILLVLYCHTSVNGLVYFQLNKGNHNSELAIFACWLWIGVCVLCGIVITNLLKCIPGVRKYL